MFKKTSKYEAEVHVDDSVLSLISSSLGYIELTSLILLHIIPTTIFAMISVPGRFIVHVLYILLLS
jgi:hypothetical protein